MRTVPDRILTALALVRDMRALHETTKSLANDGLVQLETVSDASVAVRLAEDHVFLANRDLPIDYQLHHDELQELIRRT